MLISLHHLLFVLLPVALAVRFYIKPRPATLDVAQGVLRFCLGIGKWVLLVDPLWHLATVVFRGGPESLGTSVAWMGFLGLMLSLHFVLTAADDVIAGLGGMFGFKVGEQVQDALVQTASFSDSWLHLKALFAPPPQTAATLLQQARVRTDFHVLTIVAALICLIGLPHSRDFLREQAPWKATSCILTFIFAVAMLWTHAAPMS